MERFAALGAASRASSNIMVDIELDGRPIAVPSGLTLAAALLWAGVDVTRHTPVTHAPRGPYCMMGVCFECLVDIDGEPDRQACLVPVRPGMSVRRKLHGEGAAR